MLFAIHYYEERHSKGQTGMIMVVQPGETNSFDQSWLEIRLWEKASVTVHRLSLEEIRTKVTFSDCGTYMDYKGQPVRKSC